MPTDGKKETAENEVNIPNKTHHADPVERQMGAHARVDKADAPGISQVPISPSSPSVHDFSDIDGELSDEIPTSDPEDEKLAKLLHFYGKSDIAQSGEDQEIDIERDPSEVEAPRSENKPSFIDSRGTSDHSTSGVETRTERTVQQELVRFLALC